jgi:PAS domain S-box-containing protein
VFLHSVLCSFNTLEFFWCLFLLSLLTEPGVDVSRLGAKSQRIVEDVKQFEPELMMLDDEMPEIPYEFDQTLGTRRGIDLATTLERIEKNFVITDPRLPDNPIIFASDEFLELTEYSREDIIGRNCRFLQGPDTDQSTVQKIRDAIAECRDITVQLLNYTKSGKPFWNLFHLQAVRDAKGKLQYFIGVQLDGSEYVEPDRKRLSENTAKEGAKIVRLPYIMISNVYQSKSRVQSAKLLAFCSS